MKNIKYMILSLVFGSNLIWHPKKLNTSPKPQYTHFKSPHIPNTNHISTRITASTNSWLFVSMITVSLCILQTHTKKTVSIRNTSFHFLDFLCVEPWHYGSKKIKQKTKKFSFARPQKKKRTHEKLLKKK